MVMGKHAGQFKSLFGQPKERMMPAERVKMRHAQEIFRLKFSGVATRDIALRLRFAPSQAHAATTGITSVGLRPPSVTQVVAHSHPD